MSFVGTSCWLATYDPVRLMAPSMPGRSWPCCSNDRDRPGRRAESSSGVTRAFADGRCCHGVGYIVGIARNFGLNAMTAQRQREAQDCYAALGTKVRWFTEIHYAAGNWDRKRRVIANINNDLTSGKGPIADIESLNSYFRNVL